MYIHIYTYVYKTILLTRLKCYKLVTCLDKQQTLSLNKIKKKKRALNPALN